MYDSFIEERKETRRIFGYMSAEEKEESLKKDLEAQGRLDEYYEGKKQHESFLAAEEGKQLNEEIDKANEEHAGKYNEGRDAAVRLAVSSGYYSNGVDTQKLIAEEDYELEFVFRVCQAYKQRSDKLSAQDKQAIERYLQTEYDKTAMLFPRTEKIVKAYDMIFDTIKIKYDLSDVRIG